MPYPGPVATPIIHRRRSAHGRDVVARTAQGLAIGHFRCEPSSEAWRSENQIGTGALVAIPRRAVGIEQEGRERVVAHGGQAVYYGRAQRYRRRLIDPRGDDCLFFVVPERTWSRLMQAATSRPAEDPSRPFPFARGPVAPPQRLALERLWERVLDGAIQERLQLEEALLPVLEDMLLGACEAHDLRREQPRSHEHLGTRADRYLARHYRQNWGLDDMARDLGVSPAHLARVYRRHAGRSIHQQRMGLRMHAAVELLADAERGLTDIALELGYANPSHFSSSFRRVFGRAPSALRGASARARASIRAGI